MKVLEKTVELGKLTFKVGTDRDIAVKTFEEFPDLVEYVVKQVGTTNGSDTDFFVNSVKNKELSKLLTLENDIAELIKFALPLMLKKANDETDAKSIIDYAVENNADNEFNAGMLEFLVQGFTQRELEKPKIKFSMK